jgi:hypothetical protein
MSAGSPLSPMRSAVCARRNDDSPITLDDVRIESLRGVSV